MTFGLEKKHEVVSAVCFYWTGVVKIPSIDEIKADPGHSKPMSQLHGQYSESSQGLLERHISI